MWSFFGRLVAFAVVLLFWRCVGMVSGFGLLRLA